MFEGDDPVLVRMLQNNNPLPLNFDIYKCLITGEVLKYNDFEQEILNQIHSKSCFQVGHLNPLKSTVGHTANNIG